MTASGSALSLTAVSRCLMNIVALKALSKPVIQSNYANKAMKRLETVNRLVARHVNGTAVIQTIVTVEQLPWLAPY